MFECVGILVKSIRVSHDTWHIMTQTFIWSDTHIPDETRWWNRLRTRLDIQFILLPWVCCMRRIIWLRVDETCAPLQSLRNISYFTRLNSVVLLDGKNAWETCMGRILNVCFPVEAFYYTLLFNWKTANVWNMNESYWFSGLNCMGSGNFNWFSSLDVLGICCFHYIVRLGKK